MTADTILAQVTDLPKMSLQEVKNYWIKIFKADPPPRSKKHILVKKLAYRLQEIAYGVNNDIEIRVAHYADSYFAKGGKQKAKKSYQMPIVGTKLVRTYQSIEYQVTVLEDGYEFYIYNRWGELIYQSEDLNQGWDGTYMGNPCQIDVYVWKVYYSVEHPDGNPRKEQKTGRVSLIR